MSSRFDNIQSRSIYVGASTNPDPALGNLIIDGSAGIGTTAPDSLLHIYGSTNTFTRYTNTTNSGHFLDVGTYLNGESFVYGYGAYPLLFATNGTERMRITSGGNVGIGTTTPNRKLTVAGEISSNYGSNQGALWLGEIVLQNAYFTSYGILDYTLHNGGGYSDIMRIQGNGRVGIGTTNPGSQLQVGSYFQIESNANYMGMLGFNRNVNNGQILNTSYGAYQLQNYQGSLQIQIYNSSGVGITQHTFLNNGNISFNGQLGINTTPIASLDNQGTLGTYRQKGLTTMVTDILYADGTNATRYEIARATIDYNDWNETGVIEIELYEKYWSDGLKKRYLVSYGYSSQQQKFLVEMSGSGVNNFQVSIGTPVTITGDIRYLPIYVDLRYYSRCIASIKSNRNLTTNTTPWVGEISVNAAPAMTYIPDFGADSAVYAGNVMGGNTLFPSGNVGIGTSTPGGKLGVEGTIMTTGTLNSATGSYSIDHPGVNTWKIGISNANNSTFHIGNDVGGSFANKILNITEAGNVGIGTNSPQAKLDVNGGDGTPQGSQFAAVIKGADSGNRTLYFDGATQASVWWGSGNTPQFAIDSISGGGANFWTNNGTDWSERMRIQSNGDIAINTTVASYKLDVNGWFGALRIYPYNTNSTYISGDGSGLTINGLGYLYAAMSGGSYFEGPMRLRNALSNDANSYLQINGGTANLTYFAGTIGVGTSYVYHSASITSAGKIFLAQTNNSDIGGTIYGYWDSGYQAYAGGLVFQSFNANGGFPYTMKDTMWLTGGGNLGIATSTPGARLSVIESGSTLAAQFNTNNPSSTSVSIELGAYSTSYSNSGTHIRAYVNHGSTIASSLAFEVNGQQEKMRINDLGNVGIGTTGPYTRLDVRDYTSYVTIASEINAEATTNGQAIGGIDFRKHYSLAIGASIRQLQAGGTSAYGQAHLAFYTNDVSVGWNDPVERMRIMSTGGVAINTNTTYGNGLSVNRGVSGTPSWDNATLELRSDGGLTTALAFHRAGYSVSTIYSDDGSIVFGENGGERMRISGGSVLINTSTNSGYKFEVNGTGIFRDTLIVDGQVKATVPTANKYICNIGLSGDQTIPSGTDTVVDFIDLDDANDWYDPTGKRFRPNVAGYYHVDFSAWFEAAGVTTGQFNIQIRKNGSTVLIAQQPTINNGTGQSLAASKIIYFNGGGDYIDFTAYQSTGSNKRLSMGASSSGTFANIFLIAV